MAIVKSDQVTCAAGKIESHSRADISYQFAKEHTITNIYVHVITTPENQYSYDVGINLTASQGTQESWWSRVTYQISQDRDRWTFAIQMDNWSHNNARIFQLVIEYS